MTKDKKTYEKAYKRYLKTQKCTTRQTSKLIKSLIAYIEFQWKKDNY